MLTVLTESTCGQIYDAGEAAVRGSYDIKEEWNMTLFFNPASLLD